ncbi:MAG: hypothetical protein D6775_00670 [Caldilineae bacterium]|nr:MAG: hypothetical protein D6775_00670 [Caldilineae bacterium]
MRALRQAAAPVRGWRRTTVWDRGLLPAVRADDPNEAATNYGESLFGELAAGNFHRSHKSVAKSFQEKRFVSYDSFRTP